MFAAILPFSYDFSIQDEIFAISLGVVSSWLVWWTWSNDSQIAASKVLTFVVAVVVGLASFPLQDWILLTGYLYGIFVVTYGSSFGRIVEGIEIVFLLSLLFVCASGWQDNVYLLG